MEGKSGRVDWKILLICGLGIGFMIFALYDALELVEFVSFFVGLGLILHSIHLTIRKATSQGKNG